MSLDERIGQLSETIIQEARGPIEAALHRLLGDVMTMAAADRDQAVQTALAEAAATHEAALAALREELGRDHEAATAALREQAEQDRLAAASALRESLAAAHEAATAALREQAEQDRLAAASALRESLAAEHETAAAALRERLEQERDAALAAVGADFERERDAALEDLRQSLAQDREAAVNAALESAGQDAGRAHLAKIEAIETRAAADRETAVQAVREEFAGHEESVVSAARMAAEAAAEQGRRAAEEHAAALELERDQAIAEANNVRQAFIDVEDRLREADSRVQEARGRLRDAEQQAEDALGKLAEADARAGEEQRSAALVHVADRQLDLACSDRTLAAFRRLDAARSLTEVLAALADQAAAEIGRVAILTVSGNRLRGWDGRGLEGVDAGAIDAPIEPGSIFAMALDTGLPVSTTEAPVGLDEHGLAGVLNVPPGRAGLAVPIAVGGRPVAILYADDGDQLPVVPSSWPEIAEILARHAGHRLEVLTVSHAAGLAGRVQGPRASGWPALGPADGSPQADERREEESARRYARLLISEIKLYNEPTVEQGRQHGDLLRRLGADIERARRLFEDKIPEAVRQRVDCFDQEVIRTLAGGDPGLLGQT